MKLLLDTHLILWLFGMPRALSPYAMSLVEDPANNLFFSPISIFEIAIKSIKGREDFSADPSEIHRELLLHGIAELPLLSSQVLQLIDLPPLHNDPFDRLLLAQAVHEDMFLLTVDTILTKYPTNVLDVRG